MRQTSKDGLLALAKRFVVLGSLNSVLTYAFFIALSLFIAPALAYAIAFLTGLLVVALKSNRWVFRGKDSWPRRIAFLACYLSIFLVGQGLIAVIGPVTILELIITSATIVAFSIPVVVICGQRTFRPTVSTEKNPGSN